LKRPPTLVIAAPRSGEGKTTIALGIMAAAHRRGLRVQGFKVGPDYLDTGYQALATGRPGRNLDLWMMGREAVERAVALPEGLADLVVVEGVMGLFDGHRDGVTPTSTAEVAALLGAPVVLVVDASQAAASVGALALGFRTYDERVHVAGVILNRWAVPRDRRAVEAALDRAGVDVFGYVPATPEIALPARHLGLVVADEMADEAGQVIERLALLVESHLDIDGLLRLASGDGEGAESSQGQATTQTLSGTTPPRGRRPRIAVALDAAFAFYYQDNLDALEQAGAVLVPFSPLTSEALPPCDGLYLGGGYPELHAQALAGNRALVESIRQAVAAGLPTYAECGGLLYLCETLEDLEGALIPLVGVVPGKAVMRGRLQSVGYREGMLAGDCLLGRAGDVLRGHEFHYSECVIDRARVPGSSPAYLLDGRPEGFVCGDLFASYLHLHFAGCPAVVDRWLDRCAAHTEGTS
jgi:cobyrinic acid a,c-diamide synthase